MMQTVIDWVKNLYTPPSADVIAMRELEDSRRRLLEAQSAREYADSMCKYHESRIKRLTAYVQGVQ